VLKVFRSENSVATVDTRYLPLVITIWQAPPDEALVDEIFAYFFELQDAARADGRRVTLVVDTVKFGGVPPLNVRRLLAEKVDEQGERYADVHLLPWFHVLPPFLNSLATVMEWLTRNKIDYRTFGTMEEALTAAIAHARTELGEMEAPDPAAYDVTRDPP
jgi:hypothetical protein